MPVVDPEDRKLTISCGAALYHLRLALRHFGYAEAIDALPDPRNPDLPARIGPGERPASTPEEDRLFGAILARRTTRQPYGERPGSPALLAELEAAAQAEGVWFHVVAGRTTARRWRRWSARRTGARKRTSRTAGSRRSGCIRTAACAATACRGRPPA